jgi:hypothetical protein
MLSEGFKNRLKQLAGIISEALTDAERIDAFKDSDKRVPYNKDLMVQAIKEGREVGILFQSNNEKYKMPTAKYRIIYPVALGLSKKGNPVVRAWHKLGQSEGEAKKRKIRSSEVENEWRLFKTGNIKSMWLTGNFFIGPLPSYNAADKDMVTVEVAADFAKIKQFQDQLIKQNKEEKQKNIINLFKQTGELPVEQPIGNPSENPTKLQGGPAKKLNDKKED